MARVLVTTRLPEGGLEPLARHEIDQRAGLTHEELVAASPGAEAIVCVLTDRVDTAVLDAGGDTLRVIATVAVGYDNIDVNAAHARSIAVCNTPGVLDETTADLAFHLILAARRRTSGAEADLRAGRWTGWAIDDHLGHDAHESVLGLVGYGRIGQAVARRAGGFGMEVLHHTRRDTGQVGWTAELSTLLRTADAVSLHIPLTDATRGLIGARELALMKREAVLVNTARGPVVDEEALADALEAGTIFGAGLDVYDGEPEINPRLLRAPNAVLLPHVGSATVETRTAMARLAADGAHAVLAGRRPSNLVPSAP